MSRKAVVEDIKANIDLRLIIPELVQKGARYFRKCPFHGGGEERTPSMMVEADHYFCFSCHSSGDVFDWLESQQGMDFKDAVVHLASELGIALDANDVRILQKRSAVRVQVAENIEKLKGEATPAREYLAARGLSTEVMDLAQVGYEERANAVILPFCDPGGRPIGVTKRFLNDGADPKYKTYNNEIFQLRNNVWGLQVAARAKCDALYICEGQIDCMSLWEVGIRRAVAYIGGCPTAPQLAQLQRYFPEDDWVLVPDSKSETDWELFERTYNRIMEADSRRLCRVVVPPLGMDVNASLLAENMDWLNDLKSVPLLRAEHITGNGMDRDAQAGRTRAGGPRLVLRRSMGQRCKRNPHLLRRRGKRGPRGPRENHHRSPRHRRGIHRRDDREEVAHGLHAAARSDPLPNARQTHGDGCGTHRGENHLCDQLDQEDARPATANPHGEL